MISFYLPLLSTQFKKIILITGLFISYNTYAIPAKEKQDEKLQIILNNHKQLCVYSSNLDFYISDYYVDKGKTLAPQKWYAVNTQLPQRNDFAGNGLENCVVDTRFFQVFEYNEPVRLMVSQFKSKKPNVWDSVGSKYTLFCIENKKQQIRLVGVKKQGNQFVCTDKDWQPYQPKKGFWSRLFGR